MKKITNPKWILVVNTLPLVALFIIMGNDFTLIKSLLSDDSITLWKVFASVIGVYGISNIIYEVILSVKKREIHLVYTFISLAVTIAIIYFYVMHMEDIIPFSIPQWMIPGERYVYVGTFLMPTIGFCIFFMVVKLTSFKKRFNGLISFGITLAIPLFWYLFFTVITPSFYNISSDFGEHLLIILFIAGTVLFLFFLVKSFYILVNKKAAVWMKLELVWKIPAVLILPVLGLYINNRYHVFGDFSNIWFYITVVANGVLLCLPRIGNLYYRSVLFICRMITFSVSIYFFIIFIPFLPFSVVAVIAAGAGFLMLSPIALFLIHVKVIAEDIKYLKSFYKTTVITVPGFVALMVIPLVMVLNFGNVRINLHKALNYIYSPDYSREYNIDRDSLESCMKSVMELKRNSRDFFQNTDYIPYISSLYSKVVFDNLTLSKSKVNDINRIFFNDSRNKNRTGSSSNSGVDLTSYNVNSVYDKVKDAWISTIDLELTNRSGFGFSEYVTEFIMPEGCWISNYYLYVNGVKEPGILTEKKSAMWIYSQIKNRDRRDPGILYYLTGNRIHFSVFPFSVDEVRKTGITFIHKEPVELDFDNNIISLGDMDQKVAGLKADTDSGVLFVSREEKKSLDIVLRKPFYHFIVDTSKGTEGHIEESLNKMNTLFKRNYIESNNAVVSFTNTYVRSYKFDDNLPDNYKAQDFDGGFFLERAIKKALFDSYTNLSSSFPVIVVVSDNIYNAVIGSDFTDFKIAYPESSLFYVLNKDGDLNSHSLSFDPLTRLDVEPELYNSVYAFPNRSNPSAYLPVDDEGNIVIKSQDGIRDSSSGLELQGMWIMHTLYPDETDENWRKLVKNSFETGILTPVTSYIVVENEAQRIALKRKQEQVLKGKESMDLMEEEPVQMSEPGFILLMSVVLLFLYFKRRKRYAV